MARKRDQTEARAEELWRKNEGLPDRVDTHELWTILPGADKRPWIKKAADERFARAPLSEAPSDGMIAGIAEHGGNRQGGLESR